MMLLLQSKKNHNHSQKECSAMIPESSLFDQSTIMNIIDSDKVVQRYTGVAPTRSPCTIMKKNEEVSMDVSWVKSGHDLCIFVSALLKEQENAYVGSLEEYLRALWGLIQPHQDSLATFALLAELLRDAFTAEPLPFDENWLMYTHPPSLYCESGEFILDDFAILHQMICYQISDLHLMAQAGILNQPFIHLGVDSPRGHRWFNMLRPFIYLEHGVQCGGETTCTWETLALILWLGQIYE
jgi:hypothetical protein